MVKAVKGKIERPNETLEDEDDAELDFDLAAEDEATEMLAEIRLILSDCNTIDSEKLDEIRELFEMELSQRFA